MLTANDNHRHRIIADSGPLADRLDPGVDAALIESLTGGGPFDDEATRDASPAQHSPRP